MKRVFLKLSGEALAGEKHTGFDEPTVTEVARQVKQITDQGIQVGIVIGGGNFWRGRTSETIDRTKADQIGMLATVMNCIYVSEIFRSVGMKTQILTPFECGSMTKLFSKDRANKYFEKGMVVFLQEEPDIRIFNGHRYCAPCDRDGGRGNLPCKSNRWCLRQRSKDQSFRCKIQRGIYTGGY